MNFIQWAKLDCIHKHVCFLNEIKCGEFVCKDYQPECTCHMELIKHGAIYDVYRFDCCGQEYADNRCDQHASGLIGTVCPYCGAKVVEQ